MRISDWSSDVCSSDLGRVPVGPRDARRQDHREHPARPLPPPAAPAELAVGHCGAAVRGRCRPASPGAVDVQRRSEEHTSELQSLMRISYAVFCLKKKSQTDNNLRRSTYCYTKQLRNASQDDAHTYEASR